jgi:hypothetical protein
MTPVIEQAIQKRSPVNAPLGNSHFYGMTQKKDVGKFKIAITPRGDDCRQIQRSERTPGQPAISSGRMRTSMRSLLPGSPPVLNAEQCRQGGQVTACIAWPSTADAVTVGGRPGARLPAITLGGHSGSKRSRATALPDRQFHSSRTPALGWLSKSLMAETDVATPLSMETKHPPRVSPISDLGVLHLRIDDATERLSVASSIAGCDQLNIA